MRILPRANATVIKVEGGGTSEDYDQPEGADTEKWLGSVDGYVTEDLVQAVVGDNLSQVKDTRLVVPVEARLPVAADDTVTYQYGEEQFARRVRDIEEHRVAGTVRLHLWEQ